MKKGAYVLIFFFWASLTIITPTLVQWSAAEAAAAAASKFKEDETGKGLVSSSEGTSRARKMMELFQELAAELAPPPPPPPLPPSPAPAPVPGEDEMIKEPKVEVRDEEGSSKKVVSTSRKLLQINLKGVTEIN